MLRLILAVIFLLLISSFFPLFVSLANLTANCLIMVLSNINLFSNQGETLGGFCGQFFRIFEIIIFCFVVDICDLVHNVEAIFYLPLLLTASGNLF